MDSKPLLLTFERPPIGEAVEVDLSAFLGALCEVAA